MKKTNYELLGLFDNYGNPALKYAHYLNNVPGFKFLLSLEYNHNIFTIIKNDGYVNCDLVITLFEIKNELQSYVIEYIKYFIAKLIDDDYRESLLYLFFKKSININSRSALISFSKIVFEQKFDIYYRTIYKDLFDFATNKKCTEILENYKSLEKNNIKN